MTDPPATAGRTWVRVTLRVFSDLLSPRELARRLEALPNAVYERPADVADTAGTPRTTWLRELASDLPEGLASLLGEHARFLEAREEVVTALGHDLEIDLYCGLYTATRGAFLLPGALLAQLGALGRPLVLDLYPPGSERFSSDAPLESPDWRWSRAVLLEGRRLLRESPFSAEAPLDKHIGAVLAYESSLPPAPRCVVARFTSASGHGLVVLSPVLLDQFVGRDVGLSIELVPPPFEAPPAET